MRAKNVKSVLRKKTNAWLKSLPENVREHVKERFLVTGGSIASMLSGDKVNDFDIYAKDLETVKVLAQHYVEAFTKSHKPDPPIQLQDYTDPRGRPGVRVHVKSAGLAGQSDGDYQFFEMNPSDNAAGEYVDQAMATAEEDEKKPSYRPVFLTANAITLSDRVQVVLRFYGGPEEIHETFDYVHCMQAWDAETGILHLRQDSLESLLTKELRYTGSYYPICSLVRARKFIQRGWVINAGQLFKIAYQISKLDLEDIAVLEDQLLGVDTAYFMELIGILRQRKEEGKPIDATYIMEVVDRVF